MTAHAKLSASGSATWLHCPASPRLSEMVQDDDSSVFAQEGTNAHAQAEAMLKGEKQPHPDMADDVMPYVELVQEHSAGAQLVVYEQTLPYDEWVPKGFGTADALIIKDGILTIIDLKFGKGVKVMAEDNSQLRLYALAGLQAHQFDHDITHVSYMISQPRLDHVSEETLSVTDLLAWGEWVKDRVAACNEPDAPARPGEKQCRWCKARFTCKQRAIEILRAMDSDLLTNDKIAMLLPFADLASSWANDIKSTATTKLESGESVPGYKLVEGRSQRKWTDDAAAQLLDVGLTSDKIFEAKLLGVTSIEKLLKKHLSDKKAISGFMAGITTKPAGKPAIVKTSDPRPSIVDLVANFPEV